MNKISKTSFWSCVLGNGLELYDFTLYGIFTTAIAANYFSNINESTSFFAALSSLSLGYFARPLGAIVFGHIGDKYGRKKSLIITMFLMSLSTGIIGFFPSYSSVGILASVVLFFVRLLQGICAGGETTGASIFLIEHGRPEDSTYNSAFVFVSGGIGCLAAILLGKLFIKIDHELAWRAPFIIGFLIGIIILITRFKISESPNFLKIKEKESKIRLPLKQLYINNKTAILRAISCGALSGVTSSMVIVFVNLFLNNLLEVELNDSLSYSLIGLIAFLLSAYICSKIQHPKMRDIVMMVNAVGIAILALPYFYILSCANYINIIIAQFLLGTLAGAFVSITNSFLSDQFPIEVRFSGVSIGYNLGYAICAGTFPILAFKMIYFTGFMYSPALIVIFICGTAYFAVKSSYAKRSSYE